MDIQMSQEVQLRIEKFRADLNLPTIAIIRKHIIFGDCWAFNNEKYFDLKSEVADHFKIHPNEVLVVGSARLGFSIAPRKRYRPFGDTSDIDIAIVSPSLFDRVWTEALECKDSNGYFWTAQEKSSFQDYLFRGWIRPDKLPYASNFTMREDWKEFFRVLTSKGKYGIYSLAAGLYKSWYHIEYYQSKCVRQCKQELTIGRE